MMETLRELVALAAEKYADQPAFMVRGENGHTPVSYRQFQTDVNDLAKGLLMAGLKDKHIAVIGENSYPWVISFLAVANEVGVCVTLDVQLKAEELCFLAEKGEVDALIYSSKAAKAVSVLKEKLPHLIFIAMDESAGESLTLGELLRRGGQSKEEISAKPLIPEEFRMLLFTSGTLGNAKGVMLSHHNICRNIQAELERVDAFPGMRTLSFLPIHHIYELSFGILRGLCQGATIYFSRGVRYLFADLKEIRPQFFSAVPTVVENFYNSALLKSGGDPQAATRLFMEALGGEMKIVTCGAAPLNEEVHRAMVNVPLNFVTGYGLTETSPVITIDRGETVPGSCGVLLSGIQGKIMDADEDGIGELWVKAESVMLGYYKDQQATQEVFTDGWFHTGDTGYLVGDRLYLKGRKKNLIVLTNGKKISPEEIEAKLSEFPEICACVCRGSGETGEVSIEAEVFPDLEWFKKNGQGETEEQIRPVIEQRIQEFNQKQVYYKRISAVRLRMTDFERTTTNKIKRG